MLRDAAALREAGWRLVLVHAGPTAREDLGELFDGEFAAAALFATHPGRAMFRAMDDVTRWLRSEDVGLLHAHLWNNPLPLHHLAGRFPTIATAHVPLCPNGARYWPADERPCERRIGVGCVTTGARRHGCAATADGAPYSVAGLALGIGYSKTALRALGRCRRVVAPSEWQKRRLVDDGLAADLITVLPPSIPEGETFETREAPPLVVCAGRLVRLKGFHHLIEASSRLALDHEVLIAGEGPEHDALATLAAARSVAERVSFAGSVSPQALVRTYARAAVVVVPSLWPETYGMVGPEALAAGARVVAYDVGGVSDWAENDPRVSLVPVGDVDGLASALQSCLAQDRAPARTLGRGQGPERIRRLVDLHRTATAEPSAPPAADPR